jgi:NAD(P)H-nitrite reductase large subunit
LLHAHDEVPSDLLDGFANAPAGGYDDPSFADTDPTVNVCSCHAITRGNIVHAIRDAA